MKSLVMIIFSLTLLGLMISCENVIQPLSAYDKASNDTTGDDVDPNLGSKDDPDVDPPKVDAGNPDQGSDGSADTDNSGKDNSNNGNSNNGNGKRGVGNGKGQGLENGNHYGWDK